MVRHKKPEEIRRLAADTVRGRVFTSAMIDDSEDHTVLQQIFLPLLVLNDKQTADMQKYNPVLFYEYLDEASGNEVRGYPVFYSVKMLDSREFLEYSGEVLRCEKAIKEMNLAWGKEVN